MEENDFKKLLFKTAFCCMACDGQIDEREINEMKYMDKQTSYFDDIDLSSELGLLLSDLKQNGKQIVDKLFNDIKSANLNLVQELLMLEVALRIIYSDKRIDENEVRFLKLLRSKLLVYDEVIMDRFGTVELLFDKKYFSVFRDKDEQKDLINRIKLPELPELDKIDFSKLNQN